MELILSHQNADFDCLGAMAGASLLYPGALMAFTGSQEKPVRDFLERHPEYLQEISRISTIDPEEVTRLILVDCQSAERLGNYAHLPLRKGIEIHVFDHHPPDGTSLNASGGEIRSAGAASTILASALKSRGIVPSPEQATLLMLGIYEDTGKLLFNSTTGEDFAAAAWLLSQGARLSVVADHLVQEISTMQVKLLDRLIRSLKTTELNGVAVSFAHATCDRYPGDVAALAHMLRDMENLDVLFMAIGASDRTFLVARSRVPEVDVGYVLRHLGGGGHPSAASATLKDATAKDIMGKIRDILRLTTSPKMTAGEIMSFPVKSMPADITINEARECLTRYNCNAMPVTADGRVVGIISRRTVEKAIYHDLGSAPVHDYMQTEFMRATSGTPLDMIMEYMVTGNRRFVPVFDGDTLTGAVTRTDMLRYMHGSFGRQDEAPFDVEPLSSCPRLKDVSELMRKNLSADQLRLLHDFGRTGDDLDIPVYAVGGFVRDMILGVENLDMDITVEGDGIFFAERFAESHGCRIRSHKAFGTAVIVFPDGRKVDVASTRLEYYESPGILPTVERGSLRHDLYRRDFTINTLAVALNSAHFGSLTDFFNGREDIRNRTVRVLHNLSFVEDPTRVFRAVRFEQRLGFRISSHTESLIRNSIRLGLLLNLGGKRLFSELYLILREKEPEGTIRRMASLNLLPCIHRSLKLLPETGRIIHETSQVLAWHRLLFLDETIEPWTVYLLGLLDNLTNYQFEEVCARLALPGSIKSRILSHRKDGLRVLRSLTRRKPRPLTASNSQIFGFFERIPLEVLLYLSAKSQREDIRRVISLHISSLRFVRCHITGDDLKQMGVPAGPVMGRILREVLDSRLDGEVSTVDEEKGLAKSLAVNFISLTPCKKPQS